MITLQRLKELPHLEILRFDGDFPLYCGLSEYHGPVLVDKSDFFFWQESMPANTVGVFLVVDGRIIHSLPARRRQLSDLSESDMNTRNFIAADEWGDLFEEVRKDMEAMHLMHIKASRIQKSIEPRVRSSKIQ